GRSGLLDQLGIHRRVNPYQQVAVIANVTTANGHAGVAYERFTETGPLALLPLSGQRSALVWTLAVDVAEEVAQLPDEAFLERLQAAFGFRMGALLRVGERASYPLNLIEAEEQVRSNLVVLGNAAHSLHPIAGQGFNLSLRDAMALADQLQRARREGHHPGSPAAAGQGRGTSPRQAVGAAALSGRPARRSGGNRGLQSLPDAAVQQSQPGAGGRTQRRAAGHGPAAALEDQTGPSGHGVAR